MPKDQTQIQPLSLLRSTVSSVFNNPVIFWPFLTIAFIQLLLVEILYFSPRTPLVGFFGPVISKLWGEAYLHYPYHSALIPQMFQFFQIPIYLFISSFFIGMSVLIVARVQNQKPVNLREMFKLTLSQYVYIVATAVVIALAFYLFYTVYDFTIGKFIPISRGPIAVNVLIEILVTTLFAFVIPIVMIEKAKIGQAFKLNFRNLAKCWASLIWVILIPALFYCPVLWMRYKASSLAEKTFPEIVMVILVFGIMVMTLIDAVTYTAITRYYLLRRER